MQLSQNVVYTAATLVECAVKKIQLFYFYPPGAVSGASKFHQSKVSRIVLIVEIDIPAITIHAYTTQFPLLLSLLLSYVLNFMPFSE